MYWPGSENEKKIAQNTKYKLKAAASFRTFTVTLTTLPTSYTWLSDTKVEDQVQSKQHFTLASTCSQEEISQGELTELTHLTEAARAKGLTLDIGLNQAVSFPVSSDFTAIPYFT